MGAFVHKITLADQTGILLELATAEMYATIKIKDKLNSRAMAILSETGEIFGTGDQSVVSKLRSEVAEAER